MAEVIRGVVDKNTPLIDFNTLVDIDLGCIELVLHEYRNEDIFDLNILSYRDLVYKVYTRTEFNPLYCICKDSKYKKFLDQCYIELIQERYPDILLHSKTTEMIAALDSFKKSGQIIPAILYYNDIEKELLVNQSFARNVSLVKYPIDKKDQEIYSQYFFKYIKQAEPFKDNPARTFYFSSMRLNVTEDEEFTDKELVSELMSNRSQIDIFDMYRMDILRGDNK